MMKLISGCAALALAAFTTAGVNAAQVDYSLSNVVFDDGTTATGGFSIDDTSGNLLSFDISTQAGVLPGAHYLTGDAGLRDVFGQNQYLFAKYNGNFYYQYLVFQFASPLTSGVNTMSGYYNYECDNCTTVRFIVSGAAVSGAVPEPASWALMLGGFGLVGGALRSRRKVAVSFA